MLKYMLDTNICIYTIKKMPPNVHEMFNKNAQWLCISSVTLMELIYGAEKSAAPQANLLVVEGFAARLDVLDYDASAAAQTGQIRAELAKLGAPIGPFDSQIAGHARSLGVTLITNNMREFERVNGLRVEDWVAA